MSLKFRKILIADQRYEAAAACDVDVDGCMDIVSGAYWYQGPDFRRQHPISTILAEGEYYDSFSTIPLDVTGSGLPDIVDGGWFTKTLRWHENPGEAGTEWPVHAIATCGHVETTRAWDVDGDGQLEIVPNTPQDPLVIYKLRTGDDGEPAGAFDAHVILDRAQGHGVGFGDITGNGRGDFVLKDGWLEAPSAESPWTGEWTFHQEFDLGGASVPILVADVDGDGLADLIVGQAHGYGLDWLQQRRRDDGSREWVRHPIDPFCSQYHDMQWIDIDGDGQCELVTGKRYRAHCGHDPGAADAVGIYIFKWNGESFTKLIVDHGPMRVATGCGIHFDVADVTGTGTLDILAPGKDGLYLFENLGDA